jgi:hypothetical protein
MTVEEVEEKVIELIHRQPFVPFVVEMNDGELLEIPHPGWPSTAEAQASLGRTAVWWILNSNRSTPLVPKRHNRPKRTES